MRVAPANARASATLNSQVNNLRYKNMTLPLKQSYPPMEAKSVTQLSAGNDWQYEPKWDGFRCLAFRDGNQIYLQSKSGQPLARYFPEVVENLRALKAQRFVLDGELVVRVGDEL